MALVPRPAFLRALPVLALAAGLLGTALPRPATAHDEDDGRELEVGAVPGAFRLNDQDGAAVAAGGGKDHGWFVLAFYPKALTPGCTREMCSLRDHLAELERLGAKVYGISLDDVRSQKRFAEEHSLSFPLLSDPDGSVARRYRVLSPDGRFTKRHSFVVDPAGVVRHVNCTVDVAAHGASLVKVLAELTKPR
jgi:peroxiredoxin Q/BCP